MDVTTDLVPDVAARIYNVYYIQALQGLSLTTALKQATVARSTFYRWLDLDKDASAAIREAALSDASIVLREKHADIARQKTAVQADVELMILDEVKALVRATLDAAKKSDGLYPKLHALQLLARLMKEGLTASPIAPKDQTIEPRRGLAYDPHRGPGNEIRLPDGSQVTVKMEIKTPDIIEAEPG